LDYEINWDFETYTENDTIEIDLYKGCEYVYTISSGTTNDGSFIWTIPDTLEEGNDYYIKVFSLEYPESFAFSDIAFTINNVLFVKEYLNDGVSVFPNPVQDNLVISSDDINNTSILYIFDVLGKKIINLNYPLVSPTRNINVKKLMPGVYFLSIQKGDENHIVKFVKM